MKKPTIEFEIVAILGGFVLMDPTMCLSPRAACNRNPNAFLVFAQEVGKVARKFVVEEQARRAQGVLPGMEQ